MRHLFSAALISAVSFAAPALAWNETQPASNDMAVWAYPTKHHYCPAGLQPVVIGGVVCCGSPNQVGHYQSHPAPAPKPRRVHKPRATHVSYGKGYSDNVVVYERG